MNKLEIQGTIYTEPKLYGNDETRRAIFCVQVIDEKGFKTTFPAKAWREVADKIMNLHKSSPVHFIGKITRFHPKDSENWITDVEVTELL